MGLIQNGYRDAHGSLKFAGATAFNGAVPAALHANFHQTGRNRNLFAGEGITDDKVSVPVGYRPHYCWILAQKSGGMGSTGRTITGTGGVSPLNLAAGLNAESALEGVGGLTDAAMGLIMSAIASMGGTCTFTSPLGGIISAVASLDGSSTMSAPLGAIVGALAELSGMGGVCCSNARADAFMSADIAPATTVEASVIANAVWAAVAAQYNVPGTIGEAIQAGGGGGLTTEEHNKLMKSLTKTDFIALK